MFIKHIRNYYSPEDSGGIGGDLPDLNDVDFLGEGDDNADKSGEEDSNDTSEDEKLLDSEEKDDASGDEEEESSDEEDKDDEEESDEEKESKDEVVTDGKISVKALKAQYPDIFKKNPGLKDVIFREREFSKRFGSVEDADDISARAESFDNFEKILLDGGIGEVLDAVSGTDQAAAVKIAENFLPELYSRSKDLFAKVTLPVIKGVLRNTYNRATNQGNKQLALAVQYISRDMFETADVLKATEHQQEEEDPRLTQLENERKKFEATKAQAAHEDVINNITSRLAKDINTRLGEGMSDFVKEALRDKIISELESTLAKDKAHMAHLSSLWKKGKAQGYNGEAKSKIISASLARAKSLLPSVIAKVKAQQKGGKPPVKKQESKNIPNQSGSKTGQQRSAGKLDRTMSDFEFLSK